MTQLITKIVPVTASMSCVHVEKAPFHKCSYACTAYVYEDHAVYGCYQGGCYWTWSVQYKCKMSVCSVKILLLLWLEKKWEDRKWEMAHMEVGTPFISNG